MTERTNSLLHDEATILRQIIYQKVPIRKDHNQSAPLDPGVLDALRNKKRQVAISLANRQKRIVLINIFSGSIAAEYYLHLDHLNRIVQGDKTLSRELQDYVATEKRIVIEHEDQSGQIVMSYLKRVA
ncbi:hypothetical protein SAMN05216241_1223 [Limimonas halophila]|uniref:Uncharacterized protein n=1 Tax=Limimonas halophila TaxID=1082479 RepID=A0A1G7V651_9PROT|nr:hypothetical protein [Limimonas halophila]SDG55244.1 hypothetical protein SAMN05216241_1223 [Limimonas halophila]